MKSKFMVEWGGMVHEIHIHGGVGVGGVMKSTFMVEWGGWVMNFTFMVEWGGVGHEIHIHGE